MLSFAAEWDRSMAALEDGARIYRKALASGGAHIPAAYVVIREGKPPTIRVWAELEVGQVVIATIFEGAGAASRAIGLVVPGEGGGHKLAPVMDAAQALR
jgi:hypothetical protein